MEQFSKDLLEIVGDYVCIGIGRFIFDGVNMKSYNDADIAVEIIKYYLDNAEMNDWTFLHIVTAVSRVNIHELNEIKTIMVDLNGNDRVLNDYVNKLNNINKDKCCDVFVGNQYMTWYGNLGAKCDDASTPLRLTDIMLTDEIDYNIKTAVKYNSINFITRLLEEFSINIDEESSIKTKRKYKRFAEKIKQIIVRAGNQNLLSDYYEIMNDYEPCC